MITVHDLRNHETSNLNQYWDVMVSYYIANERGCRKKALRMYEIADEQQMQEFKEYLSLLPYQLAVEVREFLEDNVKA